AERAEVAEIVKKAFSACFAASAVKENRINAVTFEHVGNHQPNSLAKCPSLCYHIARCAPIGELSAPGVESGGKSRGKEVIV
ncbi:MAG: hypothetical protein DRJ03_11325, partial [Chloroflexi bacterium]